MAISLRGTTGSGLDIGQVGKEEEIVMGSHFNLSKPGLDYASNVKCDRDFFLKKFLT